MSQKFTKCYNAGNLMVDRETDRADMIITPEIQAIVLGQQIITDARRWAASRGGALVLWSPDNPTWDVMPIANLRNYETIRMLTPGLRSTPDNTIQVMVRREEEYLNCHDHLLIYPTAEDRRLNIKGLGKRDIKISGTAVFLVESHSSPDHPTRTVLKAREFIFPQDLPPLTAKPVTVIYHPLVEDMSTFRTTDQLYKPASIGALDRLRKTLEEPGIVY